MAKKAIVTATNMKSRIVSSLMVTMETGIECQDHSYSEKILSWRKSRHPHPSVVEKTTVWSTGIVDSVLESQNGGGLAIRNSVFQRGGVGLHRLAKSGGASVAIPIHFRANREAESRTQRPMHRQLSRHPECSRIPWSRDLLLSDEVFKCSGEALALPLSDAV